MKKLWQFIKVLFCKHDYREYKWLSKMNPEQRMCYRCGDICDADDAVFR